MKSVQSVVKIPAPLCGLRVFALNRNALRLRPVIVFNRSHEITFPLDRRCRFRHRIPRPDIEKGQLQSAMTTATFILASSIDLSDGYVAFLFHVCLLILTFGLRDPGQNRPVKYTKKTQKTT